MNRLSNYRAIEEITQTDLGKILGISPQMVSAVESGSRVFSGTLAPLGYSDNRLELPEMSEPLHRQRASTKVATRDRARALLSLAGEVFGELRDITPNTPRMTLERVDAPRSVDDCEDLAVEMRYALQHQESGPIKNLTELVERAGACIVPMPAMPGVDGLSAWVNGIPVIGVAPNVPGDRLRLTIGHELAHLLFHTRKTDTTESEANRFAAALLFPERDFHDAMPDDPKLSHFVNLKSTWGVSVGALVYRAHELDHIDDRRYRALQIQMSKWRRTEPGEFPPAHGRLFNKLIDVNGGTREVAQNLGVNPNHLADLTNWTHLRVARLG